MSMTNRTLFVLLVSALAAQAAGFTADSARGERLFTTLACIQCHSINGKGGKVAPDLGQMEDRDFTPASLAATMWNHAPGMWAAMRDRQIVAGELDQQAAQDLMAFFYAARFFEKPGDAGRGKRAFESLGCAGCHGLTSSPNPAAKPVSQWAGLSDPIALLDAMWNHRADMLAATQSKGVALPQINAQQLTDMLVYLRNLPGNTRRNGRVRHRSGGRGRRRYFNLPAAPSAIKRWLRWPTGSKAKRSPTSGPKCGITRLAWRPPALPWSNSLPPRCAIWSALFGPPSFSRIRAVPPPAAASL